MDEKRHLQVIDETLTCLNAVDGHPYVLKGGTALLKCYGLDRFSEDLDLDLAQDQGAPDFFETLQALCDEQGYDLRKAKDTDTVKRAFIHYAPDKGGAQKPLKVEMSLRNITIPAETTRVHNGIKVYTLDRLSQMKAAAFMSRDRLRDLYDLTFIITQHFDQLSPATILTIHDALEYKGLEQLDYLLRTQDDGLIDKDALETKFLETFEKVGLMSSGQPERKEDSRVRGFAEMKTEAYVRAKIIQQPPLRGVEPFER